MIQELINNAAAGATVGVQTGRYAEAVNVNKRINLIALGGQVVLDRKQLRVTAAGATVTDFVVDSFDNGETITHSSGGQWNTAGIVVTADDVTMTRCVGRKCFGTGIGVGGQDTPRIWRNRVTLIDCIGEDCGRNGIAWSFTQDFIAKNCINRRNNTRKLVMEWESSSKGYITERTIIDGGQWCNNYGPGGWLDYQNRNAVVKNAEFFGNVPWNTTSAWAAPGHNNEINEGPCLYENCWFHDWAPASGALGLLETMNVTIRKCKFDGKPGSVTLYLRDNTNRAPYRLRNIRLENNEVFACVFPKHQELTETGTIIATKAGPPASWGATPPVDPPVIPPTTPRKAVKVEHVHLVTYDDGKTEVLA
jgi:hypothetical protein